MLKLVSIFILISLFFFSGKTTAQISKSSNAAEQINIADTSNKKKGKKI